MPPPTVDGRCSVSQLRTRGLGKPMWLRAHTKKGPDTRSKPVMPTLSRFPPLHHEHAANNTCYRTAVLAATSLAGLRVPEKGTRASAHQGAGHLAIRGKRRLQSPGDPRGSPGPCRYPGPGYTGLSIFRAQDKDPWRKQWVLLCPRGGDGSPHQDTACGSHLRDAVLVDDLPDIPVFSPGRFPEPEGGDKGVLIGQALREHVPGGRQETPG